MPIGQEFPMQQVLIASGNPIHHKEFLHRVQTLCRDKTNSFSKRASWCQQRNQDTFAGPIEDIENFLAKLHSEYQLL